MKNRVLVPSGNRNNYRPLERELFWDTEEQNLYIWHGQRWVLMAGDAKSKPVEFGTNLELIFPEEGDTKHERPYLKTWDHLKLNTMTLSKYHIETEYADDYGVTASISLVIEDKQHIYFKSNDKMEMLRYTGIFSTGNVNWNDTGNQWYEISMKDFRKITGIPSHTGTTLDLYDDSCWMYFDIYLKEEASHFSIDRIFIAPKKATTDDEVVVGGKIYCHNPYWLTPNDKSKRDVSDGFEFLDTVFRDDSQNLPYKPGEEIPIMSVYKTVPGGVVSKKITRNTYYPQWKGMRKLGEIEESSFFPVISYNRASDEIVGGKFLLRITRQKDIEYAIYTATFCSDGFTSIAGSDTKNSKSEVCYYEFWDGSKLIGFKTLPDVEEIIEYENVEMEDGEIRQIEQKRLFLYPPKKIEVWFNGWDTRRKGTKPELINRDDDGYAYTCVLARDR